MSRDVSAPGGSLPLRARPLGQAAAVYGWLLLVVCMAQLWLYPALREPLHSRWIALVVQVSVYLVLAAPVLLWFPDTLRRLRAPRWQLAAGLAAVIAALAYQAIAHQAGTAQLADQAVTLGVTGFTEELLFRGFLWDRCRAAGLGTLLVIAVSALAFAALHLPQVLAQNRDMIDLAYDAALGLGLGVVRVWSGNVALPGLLHTAWDLFGF